MLEKVKQIETSMCVKGRLCVYGYVKETREVGNVNVHLTTGTCHSFDLISDNSRTVTLHLWPHSVSENHFHHNHDDMISHG